MVFGHRAAIVGATVGDLCEIGNGAILMPGSRPGSGCILGEGTLLPPGTVIPADSVLVGRPPHVIRSATAADRERLALLRQHQTNLTDYPGTIVSGPMRAAERMGTLYAYRDKIPSIGAGTVSRQPVDGRVASVPGRWQDIRRPRTRDRAAGRRGERDVLDRLIDAVRAGEGRALVVTGEPGMGKTALQDYLAGHAAGFRVARVMGVQSEMGASVRRGASVVRADAGPPRSAPGCSSAHTRSSTTWPRSSPSSASAPAASSTGPCPATRTPSRRTSTSRSAGLPAARCQAGLATGTIQWRIR
jgi:hypothetical protein